MQLDARRQLRPLLIAVALGAGLAVTPAPRAPAQISILGLKNSLVQFALEQISVPGSFEITDQIYGKLVQYKGGKTDEFIPDIAAEVPTKANGGISADGLTYRFKIRKGLLFHSGDELTPEDVEYTFERLMTMDRAGGPSFLFLDILVTGEAFSSIRDDSEDGILDEVNGKPLSQAIDDAVTVEGDTVVFHLVGLVEILC